MIGYARPPLPDLVFRDGAGAVIPYGRRYEHLGWDGPEDTYSVTQHPERFAPLVTVARVIIEHLVAAYDVTVRQHGREVEVRPADPEAAGLTFTFHDFPSVQVRAGVAVDLVDMCGCDHCDEDVEQMIGELEGRISSVVDGRLREWLNDREPAGEDADLFLAYAFEAPDGSFSTSGSSAVDDRAEREGLRQTFADVPRQWSPWSGRPAV